MNEADLSPFGGLLRAFRHRRHFTQAQFASAVGVHRSAVIRWELGTFLPESKGIVLELAKHLHLDDQETRQLLEASLTALAPHWSVPFRRNQFFTGREEILELLHTQLDVRQAGALTLSAALKGLGGVGKSQIALEYAYRYGLEYSAVCWIAAETVESIVSSLMHMAEVLHLPEQHEADQQHVVAAVQHWLETHSQWLLIWDNLEDLELLDRWLPSTRLGALLLTTRCQTLGTLAHGIDLVPMAPEEGLLFLLRRAKVLEPAATSEDVCHLAVRKPAQYQAAMELVTAMGGLPLALDQAGAYLEATQCSLPTYLELFRVQPAVLLQQRGEGERAHPASVSATFTLALAATAQRHPVVWNLLRVCALVQPEAIPEALFCQGAAYLGATLEVACRDALEWNRVVASACAYSLLHRQAEEQTLSLHRLVQAVLLETMTEAEQVEWSRRVIKTLDALFPEVLVKTEYPAWKQCERLLPHALVCLRRARTAEEPLVVASLAYKVAQYLRARGRYAEAEPLLQRALCLREQVLGPAHPEVATALHYLAALSHDQGHYAEAEPLARRALQIREQALGVQHPQVATSLNYLAILYGTQGKYREAEPLLERALQIREQALGPDHLDLAPPLNNLAYLYWWQGKYREAEPLFQRALSICEQTRGPEHVMAAQALTNLALLYREQGKYREAEPLFLRALHLREQALGPEHLHVGEGLLRLADLYQEQGQEAEAESLYLRALAVLEHVLGPDHDSVAEALQGLAILYREQGKYTAAEPLFLRALHLWEQALGPAHPHVAEALQGLAMVFLAQGQEAEAEPLFQRALHIREQQLGPHHPVTAQTLHDLALFRQQQGRLREARSLVQRALSIRLPSLGATHPKTIATQALSAQLLQKQADSEEKVPAELDAAHRADPYRARGQAEKTRRSLSNTLALAFGDADPLQAFLDACCELHPLAWCRIRDLWQTYEHWTASCQGRIPLSRRTFAAQVKARGCRIDRTSTTRIWRGIRLVGKRP